VCVPSLETVDRSVLSTELEELLGHVWVQRSAHHVFLRQGPELSKTLPALLLLKYYYYYFERVYVAMVKYRRAVFRIRKILRRIGILGSVQRITDPPDPPLFAKKPTKNLYFF
jgi:hypothetical protein